MNHISPQRRDEIIDALRRGTVPQNSLDAFAVGLQKFESTLEQELQKVSAGGSNFKAIRGDYGCGKTFFTRWLADRARRMGFVTSEVQVSETETPLHRLETVYRRLNERMATADTGSGALRNIIDSWFYALEEDILAEGTIDPNDEKQLLERSNDLMEQRLSVVTRSSPQFAAALRGYRQAQVENNHAFADGILAWLSGQPNVAAAAKRFAGVKGDLDHFGAFNFLQGILSVMRDAGHAGLLVVLDEVETIQRVRSDVRDKGLNALRQWIDEIDQGRFPGLFLVVTGTPAFYDGPNGLQRLEPLAQRLHVDFDTSAEFDNPRAVQLRLSPFSLERMVEVGCKIRDIYCQHAESTERIQAMCDNQFIADLANGVAGKLGGKIGIAPRIYLKKLVADVLDRVDLHEGFDPRKNYSLTIAENELSPTEREAMAASSVDDIELDLE